MADSVSDSLASRVQALTEREKETLRLLLRGHDAKSIARDLGLSVHTVNERLRDARRKLNASSSREAARRFANEEQDSPKIPADKDFGVVHEPRKGREFGPANPRQNVGHRLAWLTGGMLVMSLVIAAAALLLVSHGHEQSGTEAAQPMAVAAASSGMLDPAAKDAARDWVTLLDNQHWQESWRAAASLFRSKLSAEQWTSMVQPIRQPLGAVSSRTVQSTTKATSLPGAPAGDYEIIQFLTNFANKPAAVETVALTHEGATWKVSGYFIR